MIIKKFRYNWYYSPDGKLFIREGNPYSSDNLKISELLKDNERLYVYLWFPTMVFLEISSPEKTLVVSAGERGLNFEDMLEKSRQFFETEKWRGIVKVTYEKGMLR